MLHLGETGEDFAAFARRGFAIPRFDRTVMRAATSDRPRWLHIGPGNLFRSVHAVIAQDLLDAGFMESGIVAVDVRDAARIAHYNKDDDLFVNVVLGVDGTLRPTVVASVGLSLHIAGLRGEQWDQLRQIATNPALQLVTLTITEKGYAVAGSDLDPSGQVNAIVLLTALLLERHLAGGAPIAIVSTDNFSANGAKLADAVARVAAAWVDSGRCEPDFLDYVADPDRVSTPWTVVDRITPAPSDAVGAALHTDFGFADHLIRERESGGPLASFSNTEESRLLAIEDAFPNGRPPLEHAGVVLTDRDTVNRIDRMKVCACLNPLHTSMALFGALLGYTSISAETVDPDIAQLIRLVGYDEGLPTVEDPRVIDPREFLDDVITRRLPNPAIPDTPQRIAADTSQKLAPRFGETLRAHRERGTIHALTGIPVTLAAWIRYTLGVDDAGAPFEPSPDPLAESLAGVLRDVRWDDPASVQDRVRPLLADATIFGIDLYDAGIGDRVEAELRRMLAGPGAVRRTLHEAVTTAMTREGAQA